MHSQFTRAAMGLNVSNDIKTIFHCLRLNRPAILFSLSGCERIISQAVVTWLHAKTEAIQHAAERRACIRDVELFYLVSLLPRLFRRKNLPTRLKLFGCEESGRSLFRLRSECDLVLAIFLLFFEHGVQFAPVSHFVRVLGIFGGFSSVFRYSRKSQCVSSLHTTRRLKFTSVDGNDKAVFRLDPDVGAVFLFWLPAIFVSGRAPLIRPRR
mmetsp:Transcript_27907/g.58199  ORF Transcript_27907/g.58199 Transcript_27907/m.58199 type:complete len:211 (+) Transcript_27907:1064-1696(+)